MSKTKEAKRAAAARKAAALKAAASSRYYVLSLVDCTAALGKPHPALVRCSDGLQVPCSHSGPRRDQTGSALPAGWAQDGDTVPGWARTSECGAYTRAAGCVRRSLPASLEEVADRAFAGL